MSMSINTAAVVWALMLISLNRIAAAASLAPRPFSVMGMNEIKIRMELIRNIAQRDAYVFTEMKA